MDINQMSQEERQILIAFQLYKKLQENGNMLPCPRCGEERVYMAANANRLSQTADVYICGACRLHEAALDMLATPKPYYDWWLIRFLGKRTEDFYDKGRLEKSSGGSQKSDEYCKIRN